MKNRRPIVPTFAAWCGVCLSLQTWRLSLAHWCGGYFVNASDRGSVVFVFLLY